MPVYLHKSFSHRVLCVRLYAHKEADKDGELSKSELGDYYLRCGCGCAFVCVLSATTQREFNSMKSELKKSPMREIITRAIVRRQQ